MNWQFGHHNGKSEEIPRMFEREARKLKNIESSYRIQKLRI